MMVMFAALLVLHATSFQPVQGTQQTEWDLRSISLTQLAERVRSQTGKTVLVVPALRNRSVSIFAENLPVDSILEAVADVLDANLSTSSWGWELSKDPAKSRALLEYLAAEDRLLLDKADAKLLALARLTQGLTTADDESGKWAKRRIFVPRFYAAGLWRSYNHQNRPRDFTLPRAFRITQPENEVVASYLASGIDDSSAQFAGTHVWISVFRHTGELRIANVVGNREEDDLLPVPYAYTQPPKELETLSFPKSLKRWEWSGSSANLARVQQPDAAFEQAAVAPLGKWTIPDKLREIHRKFHLNIVCDSFRIPARDQKLLLSDGLPSTVDAIVTKEGLFAKYENAILRVRHPGFWRLAATEPTPDSILRIEKTAESRRLTIDDYADFLVSNSRDVFTRFDQKDRAVVKFDTEPLRRAAPVIRVWGNLNQVARMRIKAGEAFSWVGTNRTGTGGSDKIELNDMAMLGPFYTTRICGREPLWFELTPVHVRYLAARGLNIFSGLPVLHWALQIGLVTDPLSGKQVIFTGQNSADAIYWEVGLN